MLDYFVLFTPIIANITAQLIKIPLYYAINREYRPSIVLSTGGMPSSHAATVTGLSTAIFLADGPTSSIFAVSLILCAIVCYDAMGVRRHAGSHAEAINSLIHDIEEVFETLQKKSKSSEIDKKFKVLLGHKPIEVAAGIGYGILVANIVYFFLG